MSAINPDFSFLDFSAADFQTLTEFGPPYPPSPSTPQFQPTIGTFDIGVSPIGDIVPFNYWSTIISQYANSRIIVGLIARFQSWLDQTVNIESLYDNIWNVLTAQGYGLDVWGRIVGVQRVVQIQTTKFFGFDEQTPATVEDFGPGGLGAFYNGTLATTSYALTDATFRTLILAKAMANISSGSVPSINAILRELFPGRGNCFVTDGLNMTMTYTFNFPISRVEYAILATSGVLPKPSGVSSVIVYPGFL